MNPTYGMVSPMYNTMPPHAPNVIYNPHSTVPYPPQQQLPRQFQSPYPYPYPPQQQQQWTGQYPSGWAPPPYPPQPSPAPQPQAEEEEEEDPFTSLAPAGLSAAPRVRRASATTMPTTPLQPRSSQQADEDDDFGEFAGSGAPAPAPQYAAFTAADVPRYSTRTHAAQLQDSASTNLTMHPPYAFPYGAATGPAVPPYAQYTYTHPAASAAAPSYVAAAPSNYCAPPPPPPYFAQV